MFHKNSTKDRNRLLSNLRQSAFYWTGFSEDDLNGVIKHSESYLEKADTDCSQHDRQALRVGIDFAKLVLAHKAWSNISTVHEMGLFVKEWPKQASSLKWSLTLGNPIMVGSSQLLAAQRFVNERLFDENPVQDMDAAGEAAMVEAYSVEQIERESRKRYHEEKATTDKRGRGVAMIGVPISGLADQPKYSAHTTPMKVNTPNKAGQSTPSKQVNSPQSSEPQKDGEPSGSATMTPKSKSASFFKKLPAKRRLAMDQKELPVDSPLAESSIIGTNSAKLTYLFRRIMDLYKEEKTLIFYDNDNTAYYIAQCLELMHIKHLIYAKTLNLDSKSKYIVSFDSDSSIRVLLMDIACGAFGLNINAASRIFFINPACQPFQEAQGIKRCHRIG